VTLTVRSQPQIVGRAAGSGVLGVVDGAAEDLLDFVTGGGCRFEVRPPACSVYRVHEGRDACAASRVCVASDPVGFACGGARRGARGCSRGVDRITRAVSEGVAAPLVVAIWPPWARHAICGKPWRL